MGRYTAEQAYSAFLSSSDLSTWRECLDAVMQASTRPDGSACAPMDLVNALSIGMYVNWLANRCGDLAVQKTAANAVERLSDDLRRQWREHPCPTTEYGIAM